jgi:hypothetical protein
MLNNYHQNIINLIKKHLTPDLLQPPYKPIKDNALAGHCYISAECCYHLFAKKLGFRPYYVNAVPNGSALNIKGVSHWVLARSKRSSLIWYSDINAFRDVGDMIDITQDQFRINSNNNRNWYGTLNYYWGKATPKGFLTKEPSKRAQILMERVLSDEI